MKWFADVEDWLKRFNLVGVYLPSEDEVLLPVPDYVRAEQLAGYARAHLTRNHNMIVTVAQRVAWGWVVVIADALDVSLSRPRRGVETDAPQVAASAHLPAGLPHEGVPALIDGLDVKLSLWVAESMVAA